MSDTSVLALDVWQALCNDIEKGEEGANLPSPGFADRQRSAPHKPTATVRAWQSSPHSAYPLRTCSDNGIVCGCKWKSGLNLKHHNEPDPKLKVRKVGVLNDELRESNVEHEV